MLLLWFSCGLHTLTVVFFASCYKEETCRKKVNPQHSQAVPVHSTPVQRESKKWIQMGTFGKFLLEKVVVTDYIY